MSLLDGQRRIIDVNGAHLRLLGYSREQQVGHHAYEFTADRRLSRARWETMLGAGSFTGHSTLRAANGERVSVQWAATVEQITPHRLILFVALSTSRWGSQMRRLSSERGPRGELSPREIEVVRLIALGQSGPEIAEELQISHDTVRTHVRNAMTKLGARSRAQLVAKSLGDGHALG